MSNFETFFAKVSLSLLKILEPEDSSFLASQFPSFSTSFPDPFPFLLSLYGFSLPYIVIFLLILFLFVIPT